METEHASSSQHTSLDNLIVITYCALVQALSKKYRGQKMSLWLLISAHLTVHSRNISVVLLWPEFGINTGLPAGVELMKDKFYRSRFWAIEHHFDDAFGHHINYGCERQSKSSKL